MDTTPGGRTRMMRRTRMMMCIAILFFGICSDEYCIVYDTITLPYRGKCVVRDSMTPVRAAVLIPQVSIPFLRAQGVWGSEHFAISSLHSVLSSHLLGTLFQVSPSMRTIRAVLHQ